MNDDDDERRHCQMEWSDKQHRILTDNGRAAEFYTAERGFPFDESELPHCHLKGSSSHKVFHEWKTQQTVVSPIVGAWKRPLFYGGWESSTDRDEDVFNLQTLSLFVDLRLPTTRLKRRVNGLEDLTATELRLYARQHIFAGYTVTQNSSNTTGYPHVCTRYHCIDWNFAGIPRNRPNKWWVELNEQNENVWKEWAYATDHYGQHYYCEHWERLPGGFAQGPVVALRRPQQQESDRDGVLVIVGDHFNYCLGRSQEPEEQHASLVDAVDAAIDQGDLDLARRWLSIEGGHGRISSGWRIDAAINYWMEGRPLWSKKSVKVTGDTVMWNNEPWQVFESNLDSPDKLEALLWSHL